MKISKKVLSKIVKATAERTLRRNANCTTCISFFQPKAPDNLKQFKQIKQ